MPVNISRLAILHFDIYSYILSFLHEDLYAIIPTSVLHRKRYREYTKRKPKYKRYELLEFMDYFAYYEIEDFSTKDIYYAIKYQAKKSFAYMIKVKPELMKGELFMISSRIKDKYYSRQLIKNNCSIVGFTDRLPGIERDYYNNNCDNVCNKLVIKGDFEELKKAVNQRLEYNEETCVLAAKYGRLDCLRFLRENNRCPWNSNVYVEASKNGHLHIIEWYLSYARRNNLSHGSGSVIDECQETCCKYAYENNHMHILKYAYNNKWLPNRYLVKYLVEEKGIQRVYDLIDKKRCIPAIREYVVNECELDIVKTVMSKGIEYDEYDYDQLYARADDVMIEWLLEQDIKPSRDILYKLLNANNCDQFKKLVLITKKCDNVCMRALRRRKKGLLYFCLENKVKFDKYAMLFLLHDNESLFIRALKDGQKLDIQAFNDIIKNRLHMLPNVYKYCKEDVKEYCQKYRYTKDWSGFNIYDYVFDCISSSNLYYIPKVNTYKSNLYYNIFIMLEEIGMPLTKEIYENGTYYYNCTYEIKKAIKRYNKSILDD